MTETPPTDPPRPSPGFRERIARYFYGDDIFISYSRMDGFSYAARLAAALAAKDFTCGFDQWRSEPSPDNPKRLLRAVARSQMLIVVGTKEAGTSKFVRQEIEAFPAGRRMVVPVDVDGTLRLAKWWPLLEGLSVAREATPEASVLTEGMLGDKPSVSVVEEPATTASMSPHEPSPLVVQHILDAVAFTKRDQRLAGIAKVALGTFVVASVVALVAFGVAAWQAYEADAAQQLANTARTELDTAVKGQSHAVQERDQAQAARDIEADLERRSRASEEAATQHAAVANLAAKDAEARRTTAERLERRSTLLTRAQTLLNADDRTGAVATLRSVLEIGDSPDARLMLADAYNRGLPKIELQLTGFGGASAVNPADEDEVAYASGDGLAVVNLTSGSTRRVSGVDVLNVAYSARGDLYAVAMDLAGPQGQRSSRLVKYDRNLEEIDRIPLLDFRPSRDPIDVFRVDVVHAMTVEDSAHRVIFSGLARSPGQLGPSPFLEWVDLATRKPGIWVDGGVELATYEGVIRQVGPNDLLTSSESDISLVDMRTSQHTTLANHPTEEVWVAASTDGSWIAGCSDTVSDLTVLHKVNGSWHQRPYQMQGGGGCSRIVFYNAESAAVARTDGTLTLIDFGHDIETWRTWIRIEGQTVFWRAPAERRLGNQGAPAEMLQVSQDGRWILTADQNNIVRLWSPYEYATVTLPPGKRGPQLAYFSRGSRELVTVDASGLARVFDVENDHRFTVPVDPEARIPEFSTADSASEWRGNSQYFAELQGSVGTISYSPGGRLFAGAANELETEWDASHRVVRSTRSTMGNGTPLSEERASPPLLRWSASVNLAAQTIEIHDLATGTPRLRLTFNRREGQPPLLTSDSAFLRSSPGGSIVAFQYGEDRASLCVVDVVGRQVRTVSLTDWRDPFHIRDNGTVIRWNVLGFTVDAPGRPLRVVAFPDAALSTAATENREWIAAGDRAGHVRLFSWQTDRYLEFQLKNPVVALAFSPNGTELAAASGIAVHSWLVPSGDLSSVMPHITVGAPMESEASSAWPALPKGPAGGTPPIVVTALDAQVPLRTPAPQSDHPSATSFFADPRFRLPSNHIDPQASAPDPNPATFPADLQAFMAGKGVDACSNNATLRFISHGRSVQALNTLVAKIVQGGQPVRPCIRHIDQVAPSDGQMVDALVTIMKAHAPTVDPNSYALNPKLLVDLEEQGVPADVLGLLRDPGPGMPAKRPSFEEPTTRALFEKAAAEVLGASVWAKYREAILATAGLPRRTLYCDDDTYSSVAEALRDRSGRVAPEAVRAEPLLREALNRFGHCADIAIGAASVINTTATIPR